jgi:cyclohexadieny/prephenate dehydrogenase
MSAAGGTPVFDKLCLLGVGLIGSSLSRRAKRDRLAAEVAIWTRRAETLEEARRLDVADSYHAEIADAVRDADLVIVCAPMGAYAELAIAMAPHLKQGAIVSDVGSVKQAALRDLAPHLPLHIALVPGHPIAGTEHSGPSAGFPELFEGRWCILTPPPETDPAAIEKVTALWQGCGSMIEIMEAGHHDQVLAITSHLPHLIAYTIVGTATDLEKTLQQEVIKFSASGFRDFTRIAASDPVMWRDIFLNNREAVLEVLQRFTEDLTALQRSIRWGEGDKLQDLFSRTRAIRRGIIEAKQA